MSSLAEFQRDFSAHLLAEAPAAAWPARAEIHRNNLVHSLIEALASLYPVTRRLVGEEFFTALARSFVQAQPPSSPVLLDYGTEFPEFVAGFEPAAALPYLPDVARLELVWHQVYHGPDARPLAIDELAEVPAEVLSSLKLRLHPAHRLLRARFPVDEIWQVNQPGAGRDPALTLVPGDYALLVVRPRLEVKILRLERGTFTFACALNGSLNLGEAYNAAVVSDAAFDVQAAIRHLAAAEIFVAGEGKD